MPLRVSNIAWPSIQRDFMRAFHASRLVTEGTSGPTGPREDGRGACRPRCFVAGPKEERRDRENSKLPCSREG